MANYHLKNPYLRNARIDEQQTHALVHYFLRGMKASRAAEVSGLSEVATRNIYDKLRGVVGMSGFSYALVQLLEDDYYELYTLFHAMRSLLLNVGTPPDVQLDALLAPTEN